MRQRKRSPAARMLAAVLCAAWISLAESAHASPLPRFFFSGDGELSFRHAHFNTEVSVRYRLPDGSYDEQALARLRHFFRSRGDGREGPLSLRLLELIDYLEQRLEPKQMILVSAYRSPEFNADLRAAGAMAARASLHTQGLAADVMFKGVDLRRAWNRLRPLRLGGLGLYTKEGFLHVDTGQPRFWEPKTSKVSENLSAGNSRLFARTEYDRYHELTGAILHIYGVTKLPLRISREAKIGSAGRLVRLGTGVGMTEDGDCLLLHESDEPFAVKVLALDDDLVPSGRVRLTLRTCEPRLEKTPAEFESNEIELL